MTAENSEKIAAVCTATSLANPCTAEALKKGQFYHAFPLDTHFYVQCDASGFPHIRPCPPSLVWSTGEVTCVRPADTPSDSGGDDKRQGSMSGSGQQQQQQQQPWQPAGAWPADDGAPMNNAQQWMVRLMFTLV